MLVLLSFDNINKTIFLFSHNNYCKTNKIDIHIKTNCHFIQMPKRRGNNEIQIARGRLKGILQDLAELDDECDENEKLNLPLRGRPPKRPKQEQSDSLVHESFIMKLFDRSLDLAKFQQNSALYSICRAWNMNKPRAASDAVIYENFNPENLKRVKMPELQDKIQRNDIGIILNMPAPENNSEEKFEKKEKRTVNEIAIDSLTLSSEELLKDYKTQWKKDRENWMEKVKKRQNRYTLSFQLLNAIKEI